MEHEEGVIKLDLSVETLALLGRPQPDGQTYTDSAGPILRCCGSGGSDCTPPTCCP